VVEESLLLPSERFTPYAEDTAVVKILIQSIKNSLMMDMGKISQEADPLFVSFFIIVVFRELQLLDTDNIVLKLDEPVRLENQKMTLVIILIKDIHCFTIL